MGRVEQHAFHARLQRAHPGVACAASEQDATRPVYPTGSNDKGAAVEKETPGGHGRAVRATGAHHRSGPAVHRAGAWHSVSTGPDTDPAAGLVTGQQRWLFVRLFDCFSANESTFDLVRAPNN